MTHKATEPDKREILLKAVHNAAKDLGIPKGLLVHVLGRSKAHIYRPINPESKEGELALMFVRVYRALYALMNGDLENMRHWMYDQNKGVAGVPVELIQTAEGLVTVLQYLDAMRGKI